MATASPPPFSRSSSMSVNRSPGSSSRYPDRAIRPLPRSSLKSKLSPEQAASIIWPSHPPPPPISPTLSFAGGKEGVSVSGGNPPARMTNGEASHTPYLQHQPHVHADAPVHTHCTCGEDVDSGDEEVEFDHPDYRYASPTTNGTAADPVLDNVQRRLLEAARNSSKSAPPASAASSADGYESFENTSNKKKRKIPLSAASSNHQSQLSDGIASMGISGSVDGAVDDVHGGREGMVTGKGEHSTPPPLATNTGTGISGAGRGRYGRQNGRGDHSIRRILGGPSMNAVNGYHPRPPTKSGGEVKSPTDAEMEGTGGIISQAIKSAAEQGPMTPQKGQELVSLLQTATSSYSSPANAKTQFTFSVESESANKMLDQQAAAAAAQASYSSPSPNTRGVNGSVPGGSSKATSVQSTQTTSTHRSNNQPPNPNGGGARPPPNAPNQQQPPPPAPAPAPKPKPRRRPSKEYALAARQRRLQQEYTNYHQRPTKDNMWICEFCEYEDIFGVPPVALIRQYEAKDRQERKRQAEKRRLLEKAKAKNRKGKKGNKKGGGNNANNAANSAAAAANAGGQPYDPNLLPHEDEEYYDDNEYGDEYEPVGPDDPYPAEYYPPPVPSGTPQAPGGPKQGG